MKAFNLARITKVWLFSILLVVIGGSLAGAAELYDLSEAKSRVNGVDGGLITADQLSHGWSSKIPLESKAFSDYLFYDLSGKPLNVKEGSIAITVIRSIEESPNSETLFCLAGPNWERKIFVSALWGDEESWVGLSGLNDYLHLTDPIRNPPAKGGELTFAFSWNNGDYHFYVNGSEVNKALVPGGTIASFEGKVQSSRYLVLGGVTDPSMPQGSWAPMFSKVVAFNAYDNSEGWKDHNSVRQISTDKNLYSAGKSIKALLKGAPGRTATFSVAGIASGISMKETAAGVYEGQVTVPAGTNIVDAAVIGSISSSTGVKTKNALPVTLDSIAPAAPESVVASASWGGEIEVGWTASASKDTAFYKIYRSPTSVVPLDGTPLNETSLLSYTDKDVIPGLTYYYAIVPVDKAENVGESSMVANAKATAGEGPTLSNISADPLNKPMRPGQSISFTIKGATRGAAKVEILGLNKKVDLSETGATGVYKGSYQFSSADAAAATTAYQVVGYLTDDFSTSKFAGPQVVVVGQDVLSDNVPPAISIVEHDAYKAAGFSGKLVSGDSITVTLEGEPKGFASFSLVGVTGQQTMTETAPGVYKGSYTVGWTDEGTAIPVEASLSDLAGNETRAVSTQTVDFDTRVRVSVTANDLLLPADKTSKTRIVVKTTDANGDDVSGHELMLKLHTTDEYTGVVGGGKVANKFASKDDEDDIEVKWGGKTDSFGEIAATYTAGFAAKTALIIAKDLTSGDVGAGWLNTYVASTVSIQLTPSSAREASIAPVIRMSVTPGWLTADGRSKARVRAWLTETDGTPIKGARVRFEMAGENGSIKTLRGITDAQGLVEADYRAGTLAGMVTILAAAPDDNVTGAIQIELKSDAPAKIGLVASTVSMPADGRSISKVKAFVSDINDNPNKQSPVVFSIIEGSGTLDSKSKLTDDRGLIESIYTAGRNPGTTIVEARHTSRAPTTDELKRVYGTIFIPKMNDTFGKDRIRVEEWYVKVGATVLKGQALAKISSKGQTWLLHAPEDGVLANQVRHKKDYVELGDTIGYIEIDDSVWKSSYIK